MVKVRGFVLFKVLVAIFSSLVALFIFRSPTYKDQDHFNDQDFEVLAGTLLSSRV